MTMTGYLRNDGRKGIRNTVVIGYLVECAHHVSREIALHYRDHDVHVIGFPGCYPNGYALNMMEKLCTHPNVGAVLLVSLGCEAFNRSQLERTIKASGRPVETLVIQNTGGTAGTVAAGIAWVARALAEIETVSRVEIKPEELVIGTTS